MPHIFLSHSSDDSELAREIEHFIVLEFQGATVFRSSSPSVIPLGWPWLEVVLNNLASADILLVLLTPQSINRLWVGFEVGYFWSKVTNTPDNTSPLHPSRLLVLTAGIRHEIPSPISHLQIGVATSIEMLEVFLDRLSEELAIKRSHQADVAKLRQRAARLAVLDYVAILSNYLDKELWVRVAKQRDGLGRPAHYYCKQDDRIHFEIEKSAYQEAYDEKSHVPRYNDKVRYLERYDVQVYLSGRLVDSVRFVSMIGGRQFIPEPDVEYDEQDQPRMVWHLKSKSLLIAEIVGNRYLEISYEDLANDLGIRIHPD